MQSKTRYLHWLWLSAIIIILDQLSKHYVVAYLDYHVPVKVLPVLDLVLSHNTGAAFSLLDTQPGWQIWLFGLIAIVVCVGIVVWLTRLPAHRHWLACSLSLIVAGALGNLIDRIRQGYVVDFIQIHYQGLYYPAIFNIADLAISAGAVMLVISLLRKD